MKIAMVTDVIHPGGAETFILRLTRALQDRGGEVFLYIFYHDKIDRKLIEAIAPGIRVIPARLRFIRMFQLLDGLLLKLKLDFSLINFLLIMDLKSFLKRNKIELVHSHLFTADRVAVEAAAAYGTPVVTTMHGDYALLWERHQRGEDTRMIAYPRKMAEVLKKLKAVVCISDGQLCFFAQFTKELPRLPVSKIYNGYAVSAAQQAVSKEGLNIPDDYFVLGMVARGIPEKGWREVIEAFIALDNHKCVLLLVGNSAYVQSLKKEFWDSSRIRFIGYSKNPVAYIKLFDAGLFASTYGAESLPTVIMEYLACGIPVIATDTAECRKMLETDTGSAGMIVNLHHNKIALDDLTGAMQQLINSNSLYKQLKKETGAAFKKFDMGTCVDHYMQVYTADTQPPPG